MASGTNRPAIQRNAYRTTRSLLRMWRDRSAVAQHANHHPHKKRRIKIAFIHNEHKLATGAHHINDLIGHKLEEHGALVHTFYPRWQLTDVPSQLRGIANILFFHSLLEHKDAILRHDILQGTTYTLLPFVGFDVPTVSHFGSMMEGILKTIPPTSKIPSKEKRVWREWYDLGIIPELDYKTFHPLRDIADVENLVAQRATACVAASVQLSDELKSAGVLEERIHLIHNAIEDYWFSTKVPKELKAPQLIFLGRLGEDVFNFKIKGLDRLVGLYRAFPDVPKTTICMTVNRKLKNWLRVSFPLHYMFVNLKKDLIPQVLAPLFGSILFISSRYEGFSLSLAEGMSQGLVPVAYPVGVAPEIIKNGVNGFIVSNQEEAIARTRELLSNTEKRIQMAHAAKKSAEAFTSDHMVDKLFVLYQKIRKQKTKLRS